MIALVIVSHSANIAVGLADLIREMAPDCPLRLAAGIDDPEHSIGTDAVKILDAVESLAAHDGIVLLVDLGSAILSAQTALELLAPDIAEKTRIAAAPLVEGGLAAAIAAASGASLADVVREAENALAPKQQALGSAAVATAPEFVDAGGTLHQRIILSLAHGLHARPAAKLVATLRGLNADCQLEYQGQRVNARSLNSLMALAIPHGAALTLHASGEDARKAIDAFGNLAAANFGEAPPSA